MLGGILARNPRTKIARRQNAVNSVTHEERIGAARSSASADGQDSRMAARSCLEDRDGGGGEKAVMQYGPICIVTVTFYFVVLFVCSWVMTGGESNLDERVSFPRRRSSVIFLLLS